MSEFSEKLRLCLKRTGHTTASFSKMCNIERTVFHKYGNGERLPHNLDTVEMIADKLMLSIDDKNEIIRLWSMERIGKDTFLQREGIKSLLEELDVYTSFHSDSSNFIINCELSNMKTINIVRSELELQVFIGNILKYESTKENFTVRMYVQPIYNFLLKALLEYSQCESLSVTQLVCFHQHKSTIEKNIKYVKNILPLAFCLPDYKARVYYDHAEHHINNMSILPNMILTDEFVILFSYDGKDGIIYRNKELYDFYSTLFENMSKQCKGISSNCCTVDEYMGILINKNFKYFLNQNPCLGMGFTKEFLDEVLIKEIPFREVFIHTITEDMERRTLDYQKHYKCYAFFTKEGILKFLRTGRDNEFPPELYRHLSPDESKALVQKVCDTSKPTYVHNRLIDDTKFQYESDVIIHAEIGGLVIFQKPNGQFHRRFVVFDESSINEMFIDFFSSLEEMQFIKSEEDTLEYLKKLI